MRLLNTASFELREDPKSKDDTPQPVPYAILSHRWRDAEITYQMLEARQAYRVHPGTGEKIHSVNGMVDERTPAARKIRGACDTARRQGIEWIWIDSLCLNRQDTDERSRGINSMFGWYEEAEVCYTYFDDFTTGQDLSELGTADWFTRGWTLQELLAPEEMQFYNAEWNFKGTRNDLAAILSRRTGIRLEYLTREEDFREASIAAKMSWQAGRTTTEVEDVAYSMLGIFNVTLAATYGEKMRAFHRLQEQILKKPGLSDESIFAWEAAELPKVVKKNEWAAGEWGLLAPSPHCFVNSGDITCNGPRQIRGRGGIREAQGNLLFPIPTQNSKRDVVISLALLPTFVGTPIYLLAVSRARAKKPYELPLNCWRDDHQGKRKAVQIHLKLQNRSPLVFTRMDCARLGLSISEKVPSSVNEDKVFDATILQPELDVRR